MKEKFKGKEKGGKIYPSGKNPKGEKQRAEKIPSQKREVKVSKGGACIIGRKPHGTKKGKNGGGLYTLLRMVDGKKKGLPFT